MKILKDIYTSVKATLVLHKPFLGLFWFTSATIRDKKACLGSYD